MQAKAIFERSIQELVKVPGVFVGETHTSVKTTLLRSSDDNRVRAALAWPIAKSTVPMSPDYWTFSGDVETSFREDKRREQMLTVSSRGESFEANPEVKRLEFETSEYGNRQLYVGIKDAMVEVMALWYIDDNGNHVGKWFIDLYRFGASQGPKVKIMHEVIEWLFLTPLMTAILTGNFASKNNIRNSIKENIKFHCDDWEMRKFLLNMADAMAVAYLHLFDKEAELAKPEQTPVPGSKAEAPPPVRLHLFRQNKPPVPKAETHDITPAPAPEPEQVQAKAEEPVPMPSAHEPEPTVPEATASVSADNTRPEPEPVQAETPALKAETPAPALKPRKPTRQRGLKMLPDLTEEEQKRQAIAAQQSQASANIKRNVKPKRTKAEKKAAASSRV